MNLSGILNCNIFSVVPSIINENAINMLFHWLSHTHNIKTYLLKINKTIYKISESTSHPKMIIRSS